MIAVEKFLGLVGGDALVEIIVHEANRSGSARSETFGELHRVISAGRNRDRVLVRVGGVAVDSGELAKFVHELVGTAHGAGKSAADADVKFARSFLTEARVEGDNFDDLDRFDVEFVGDPVDGLRADVAEAMLYFVKKGKYGGAFLVVGILCDAFIGFFL